MAEYEVSTWDYFVTFEVDHDKLDIEHMCLETFDFFGMSHPDNPLEEFLKLAAINASNYVNRSVLSYQNEMEGFLELDGRHGIELKKVSWEFHMDELTIREL